MATIALTPRPNQLAPKGTTAPQDVATPTDMPGTIASEDKEVEPDDAIEVHEFPGDEDLYAEEPAEDDESSTRAMITRLTVAIIPFQGARNAQKSNNYIDLSHPEMYYDESNKAETYATISAKLGKTRAQLIDMLFGY